MLKEMTIDQLQEAICVLVGAIQMEKQDSRYHEMLTYYMRQLLEVQMIVSRRETLTERVDISKSKVKNKNNKKRIQQIDKELDVLEKENSRKS